ncbi:MAG: hypothetical protein HDR83_07865 [Bacteroides sp.]|nr:hypothetical protein [Bacteroidales bacterium]MBD5250391.1 hypothetical protein [Barnesiella sp.]MBD5254218.1 hypothetical protein [Barnesiella sp.]MBD5344723.1 hypothetical protein [Bacteroides sp.]MBD5369159.1 hypothetical protein [Bacteroides sp.]
MNISRQDISPVDLRLTVDIDENDYKDEVTKKIKEIGRTHALPGFRKGHVPFGELKRRFGKQVATDVLNDVVYRAIIDYIKENNLHVMGHPLPVEVKEVALEGAQQFAYDVALLPTLDIKLDKEFHFPFYDITVSDEMVDEQDKAFRKRFGKQQPGEKMEEDAVVKGSIMQLNAEGQINTNEGAIQMTNGIVFPLYFKDKEQTAKFADCKPGDKVVFNPWAATGGDAAEIASMLGIDKAIAADMKDDFEMNVSEIIVNIPAELGEEFYKQVFGEDKVHNEEEYRAEVKKMIENELSSNSHIYFRNKLEEELMAKYADMQLPKETIKKIFFADAEDPEAAFEANRKFIQHEVLEANLVEAFGVKVEEEEMLDLAKFMTARQFAQYGLQGIDDEILTKYAKEQLENKETRNRIFDQVLGSKLYSAIEEAITLDHEAKTLDEFKAMVQPAE